MPLFGRGSKQKVQPAVQDAWAQATQPCSHQGCSNHNGLPCNYVDHRRRRCDTAWCSTHAALVGAFVYCRRHAGTIAAIGFVDDPYALPDLDNRAPSLTNWVARDLDGFIAAALAEHAARGESVIREPLVKMFTDPVNGRRFERTWKLVDHTGVSLVVGVFVFEDDDSTVHVKVGAGVVAEGVPPWIERHQRGIVVDEEVDRAQRGQFYGFLQQHIIAGIQKARVHDQQHRY